MSGAVLQWVLLSELAYERLNDKAVFLDQFQNVWAN
jgi:hypothetical protein